MICIANQEWKFVSIPLADPSATIDGSHGRRGGEIMRALRKELSHGF